MNILAQSPLSPQPPATGLGLLPLVIFVVIVIGAIRLVARSRPASAFPVLTFVSVVLRVVGWLVSITGIILLVVRFPAVLALLSASHADQKDAIPAIASVAAGLFSLIIGLVAITLGEAIGVLFAIEANTRQSADKRSTEPPPRDHEQ